MDPNRCTKYINSNSLNILADLIIVITVPWISIKSKIITTINAIEKKKSNIFARFLINFRNLNILTIVIKITQKFMTISACNKRFSSFSERSAL